MGEVFKGGFPLKARCEKPYSVLVLKVRPTDGPLVSTGTGRSGCAVLWTWLERKLQ